MLPLHDPLLLLHWGGREDGEEGECQAPPTMITVIDALWIGTCVRSCANELPVVTSTHVM